MTDLDDMPGSDWKFETGAVVHWRDPDEGIGSGEYTIIERIEWEADGYSLYLLSNGRFNIEALEKELT